MTTHIEVPIIGKLKHPYRWLIGLLAAGAVITGVTTTLTIANRGASKENITQLTVPVQTKNITLRITASGTVTPVESVNISPKNPGILEQLYVEQGDKVKQGQIIARMDSSNIQTQVQQARAKLAEAQAQLAESVAGNRPEEIAQSKARLAQAEAQLAQSVNGSRPEDIAKAVATVNQYQAQLKQAQSSLALANERVNRQQYAVSQGALARDTLDESLTTQQNAKDTLAQVQASLDAAKQDLARLRNGSRPEEIQAQKAATQEARAALQLSESGTRPEEIAQRKAAVAAAQADLQTAEVNLDDTIIRAPFSGVVTQKYASKGAYVAPATSASSDASATSTSIIALAHNLEVLADVPETDIGRIKQGQQVEIVADAYPDQVFKGHVRLIAPEAVKQEGVTLFQVRVAIDTGDQQLRSGLNVNLTFLGDQVNNALLVPTVTIVTEKGKTGVLIPDAQNKAQFHPVTIGSQVKDETQILSGLQQGQRVFISPPKDYKIQQAMEEKNQ